MESYFGRNVCYFAQRCSHLIGGTSHLSTGLHYEFFPHVMDIARDLPAKSEGQVMKGLCDRKKGVSHRVSLILLRKNPNLYIVKH